MGFEFILLTQQLTTAKWQQAIACFEATDSFRLVKTGGASILKDDTASYAFPETTRPDWPEDFYLARAPAGLYLCFHSANDQQQRHVIKLLTACLLQIGISEKFNEL